MRSMRVRRPHNQEHKTEKQGEHKYIKKEEVPVVLSTIDEINVAMTITYPDIVSKSIAFVNVAHRGLTREYSKIPYVFHLFDVAKHASSYMQPMSLTQEEFMSACILHDTIEDTNATYDSLVTYFNKKIADVVLEVSRPKEQGNTFIDKYNYLKTFYNKSKEAIILKIADRICNVRDYQQEPSQSWYAMRYALQAYPVYKAYANLNKDNTKIFSDIFWIENLVSLRYNVSVLISSEEEIEKALGLEKNKE